MIANPVIPLEERYIIALALFEQFLSVSLYLNQLLLFFMCHDLRQKRHMEELMVGIFPHSDSP